MHSDAPEGEADDIAIGPNGEMAWTSYLQGVIPPRLIAKDIGGFSGFEVGPGLPPR